MKRMKRITYYAVAENADRNPELMIVVRENGKQVSQTFTGEVFSSLKAALAETGRRNGQPRG